MPNTFLRRSIQFPSIVLLTAAIAAVRSVDWILDHVNTPLANLIDRFCLNLRPDLGTLGAMIIGSSLHAVLFRAYLAGVSLLIPAALPYMFVALAGVTLLNEIICLNKINNNAGNAIMRHTPLAFTLDLTGRLLSNIIAVPDIFSEALQKARSYFSSSPARTVTEQASTAATETAAPRANVAAAHHNQSPTMLPSAEAAERQRIRECRLAAIKRDRLAETATSAGQVNPSSTLGVR